MAALVQAKASFDGTAPSSISYASNNTAGNLLLFHIQNSTGRTVSDSQGNIWLGPIIDAGGTHDCVLYYVAGCKAGANTVSLAGGGENMAIFEFSGYNTFDVGGFGGNYNTSQSTWTSNAITTTKAVELIFGFIQQSVDTTGLTVDSPYTKISPAGSPPVDYEWYYEEATSIQTGLTGTGSCHSGAQDHGWMLGSFYLVSTAPLLMMMGLGL